MQRMQGLISLSKGKTQITDRKKLAAQLDKIRAEFAKVTQNHKAATAELAKKQQEVDDFISQRNDLRDKIIQLSNNLRTMDLTGAQACRDRKGIPTFYIGKKEFAVNDSNDSDDFDSDVALVDDEDEDNDFDDDLSFASDIIRSTYSRL